MWTTLQPGQLFDAKTSSPILAKTLQELDVADVHQQRAIVPGCGRGYDLATLARAGYHTAVGLDIVPSAVRLTMSTCGCSMLCTGASSRGMA